MKRQLVLPENLVKIFGGNNEEALRAFLLSVLTPKKQDFAFADSSNVWEEVESVGPFHGGKITPVSRLWFEFCLLSYSEKPLPSMIQLSGTPARFMGVFYGENNTRCFAFKVDRGKLDGVRNRSECLVFVFAPFLPKNFWEEISLGFGTMCNTDIDENSGIHQGILELSSKFTKNILSCVSNQSTTPDIWLLGMSMGGALAKASLWHLRKNGWGGKATVKTFGCPRIGNKKFSLWFEQNCEDESFSAALITNDGDKIVADPVSLFPPKSKGYEDCPFFCFLHNKVLFTSDWLRSTQPDLDISVSSCLSGVFNISDVQKYGLSNMGIGDRNREWEIAHNPQIYFDNLS